MVAVQSMNQVIERPGLQVRETRVQLTRSPWLQHDADHWAARIQHCQYRHDKFFHGWSDSGRCLSLGKRSSRRRMKLSRHHHLRDLLRRTAARTVSLYDKISSDRRLTACCCQCDAGRRPAASCSSMLSGAGPGPEASGGGELEASLLLGLLGLLGLVVPMLVPLCGEVV